MNILVNEILFLGIRLNISIALQYLNCWLRGLGAVAIHNLMEDAATAEISRAQLWQWLHHSCTLDDGRIFDLKMFKTLMEEELGKLGGRDVEEYGLAANFVEQLVRSHEFADFITLPAYDMITVKGV